MTQWTKEEIIRQRAIEEQVRTKIGEIEDITEKADMHSFECDANYNANMNAECICQMEELWAKLGACWLFLSAVIDEREKEIYAEEDAKGGGE